MPTAAELQAQAQVLLAQAQQMGGTGGAGGGAGARPALEYAATPQAVGVAPDAEWHADGFGNSRKVCRRFQDSGE